VRIGVNTLFLVPGEVGGTETYLRETLDALTGPGGGHEWVLFTNRENHDTFFPRLGNRPGVFYQPLEFRAASRPARILREQSQLPWSARRWNLDVLWSPGYTAPLLAPCPQAVTVHDVQYKRFPEDLSRPERIASDVLIRGAVRRCSRILAVSEFTRSEIGRFYRVPADRLRVTPEAADPGFGVSQPGPVFERLASEHRLRPPYLLCVAHSYPHKNLHALAGAFAGIQRRFPHQLVLVGKPRRGEARLQAALSACAPDRVRRLSGLSRAELISLYQRANLFVFPSLYEGFGLPVLEAMLAGAPVLTTRCGAIPEVGGDTVEYFDPERPDDLAGRLAGLLAGPWNATARARARAETFSWKRTAGLTLEALREAAGGGR
jgi:glycosyltransferase involved in cell wall biosynthesis